MRIAYFLSLVISGPATTTTTTTIAAILRTCQIIKPLVIMRFPINKLLDFRNWYTWHQLEWFSYSSLICFYSLRPFIPLGEIHHKLIFTTCSCNSYVGSEFLISYYFHWWISWMPQVDCHKLQRWVDPWDLSLFLSLLDPELNWACLISFN